MQCPYCREEILDGAIKCKHCGSSIGDQAPVQQDVFGELFTAALNVWKANLGDLTVLTLVFVLVVWIPIVNVGFIAGYIRSLLKVARGQGFAQVGDLFNSWDCFGNLLAYLVMALIACVILSVVPVIGSLAGIALGFVLTPGIYAIVDQRRSVVDAFKWSIETIRANFVNWLLVYLVGNVITAAGIIALFIGIILTAPLGTLLNIFMYDKVKPA
jgi:uncharacterized membrane protein